jgi:hypothetical protein
MTLTVERLRELLTYDPETGELRWRVTRRRAAKGSLAGTLNRNGYRNIEVEQRCYKAHRLAWLYVTGEWPKETIDHINCKRDDNRWANLRQATTAEN